MYALDHILVVAGRTHEMGVRMALGGAPLGGAQARGQAGHGPARGRDGVGVPAALGAAHLLGRLLYGVGPGDPLTLAGVIAVIAGVTSISAYVPARRATRVDPATVLRGD